MSKSIKIFWAALFLCASIVLGSCVGSSSLTYYVDKKVVTVDLINYDNPDARNNPSEIYAFDLEKIEVLEALDLDSTEFEDFSKEMNIRVHMKMNRKQFLYSHDGKGLRIVYKDGSFQIITLTNINDKDYFFVGIYDVSGAVEASKDVEMVYATEKFRDVINKYFTTQI